MKKFVAALVGLVILTQLVGCGPKKPDGMPKLYPCELTFTQGGKPVEGVLVNLYPDEGCDQRWRSGGTTDASGVIRPRTEGKFDGVPVGKYKITAFKTIIEDGPAPTEEQIKNGDTNFAAKQRRFVDPQFEFPDQTPLRLEVKEGKNAETFDLGDPIEEESEADGSTF